MCIASIAVNPTNQRVRPRSANKTNTLLNSDHRGNSSVTALEQSCPPERGGAKGVQRLNTLGVGRGRPRTYHTYDARQQERSVEEPRTPGYLPERQMCWLLDTTLIPFGRPKRVEEAVVGPAVPTKKKRRKEGFHPTLTGVAGIDPSEPRSWYAPPAAPGLWPPPSPISMAPIQADGGPPPPPGSGEVLIVGPSLSPNFIRLQGVLRGGKGGRGGERAAERETFLA